MLALVRVSLRLQARFWPSIPQYEVGVDHEGQELIPVGGTRIIIIFLMMYRSRSLRSSTRTDLPLFVCS